MDASGKFPEECFFIAPIGADDSEIRKRSDGVMTFIVQKAAEQFNLTAVRADKISSPGQINLQVIEHVLGARAAVADLTGLNPNVFYEMAVRHTAKLPLVIIAEKGTDLPFDIAQMRTIFFDHTDLGDADRCRAAIVDQLNEALNNGVVDSPISTAVDLSLLSAGGAADRSIAELVTTVESLASAQRMLADRVEFANFRMRESMDVPPGLVADLYDVAAALDELHLEDDETKKHFRKLMQAAEYLDRERHGRPRSTRRPVSSKLPTTEKEKISE